MRYKALVSLPSHPKEVCVTIHWVKGEAGFQSKRNEEKDEYVALVFGEMKVREHLVFDKHLCRLAGFVKLGQINDTLNKIEKQCKDREQHHQWRLSRHAYAGFHYKRAFTNIEFVFAQFLTNGVSGDSLFPIAWEAIRNIEECNLKVVVMTANGASPNPKMHQASKAWLVVISTSGQTWICWPLVIQTLMHFG